MLFPGLKSGACNQIVKLPGLKAGVSWKYFETLRF